MRSDDLTDIKEAGVESPGDEKIELPGVDLPGVNIADRDPGVVLPGVENDEVVLGFGRPGVPD